MRFNVSGLPDSPHGQPQRVAGLAIEHRPLEIQRPLDFRVVHGHDHVAGDQPGLGGGTFRLDARRRPCPAAAKRRSTFPRRSTSCSALQLANSADGDGGDLIDGNGEADALGAARTATLMPIMSPSMFSSGPPELPGLMLASVWIRSS